MYMDYISQSEAPPVLSSDNSCFTGGRYMAIYPVNQALTLSPPSNINGTFHAMFPTIPLIIKWDVRYQFEKERKDFGRKNSKCIK